MNGAPMNCWVLISKDNATRGPATYGDTDDAYRYDSLVPNFKQLAVGDVVFMSDYESRILIARVVAIDEADSVKELHRCPQCKQTSQTRRAGSWRCSKCKIRYPEPIVDHKPVRAFTAHLGASRPLEEPDTWIRRVKAATKPKLQTAIRLLEPNQISPPLADLIAEQIGIGVTLLPAVEPLATLLDADVLPASPEGRRRLVTHLHIERSSAAARQAKQRHAQRDPRCPCEVCGVSFEEMYGDHGAGYIEAHHREPLSSLDHPKTPTPGDFALVCGNCHRMLHRVRDTAMTVEQLATLLRQRLD